MKSDVLRSTLRRLLVLALVAAPLAAGAVDITYRHFSGSAAIGPPADAFAAKLRNVTTEVLGPSGEVRFVKLPGLPAIGFGNDLVKAVGAGRAGGGFDAAYTSGSELNKAWGFIYNSGVPFGPAFDEYLGFLYGKSVVRDDGSRVTGLQLLQSIFDANGSNVVAVPIVGSTEQLSGYFSLPVGDAPDGTKGIGLAGLCQQPWRFRYLLPGENVLTKACDNLVARGVIPARAISFIQAIPGGGSLVDAVKLGQLEAFEFATPLDDVSQLFNGVDNPGTVGLRYVHLPGWQQQFLITWMLVNKDVWNGLTPAQRLLMQTVGRDHVLESYGENMRQQGPALRYILDANRGDGNTSDDLLLVQWPKKDIELMREATNDFLTERASDPALSARDRADFVTILEALRQYVASQDLYWDNRPVRIQTRFEDWTSPAGQSWVEKYRYEKDQRSE